MEEQSPREAEEPKVDDSDAKLLPDREAMSLVTPTAITGVPDVGPEVGPPPDSTT
jgi:hypothetical protein